MRILLLHQYFLEENDPGGSRWNETTRLWTELGHEVTVIAGMVHANGTEKRREYKGRYFIKRRQGNVNVLRCHVSEAYNKGFAGRLWGYFSFMFSSLWGGAFKTKGKFDLILVTSPPLFVGISGYLLSRLKRIPLVFEIRDLWPESAIDTGVLKNDTLIKLAYWVENFIYRKSRLINVLTPAFRDTLITKKGVSPDKIIFIPNAADFSLSDKLLANFDRSLLRTEQGWTEKFVVTYVGAHGVANHLEQVLDTANLLRDTNVLFVLIGQGMQKQMLMERARSMKLENVQFMEPVSKEEVFKYILSSEMGASVLKNVETFKTVYSNKSFDYMACKKPILMAIDGISRELIEQAGGGTFVKPEDPQDFAMKIRAYLADKGRVIREGELGYEFAKVNFDRTVLGKRYMEHLEKIRV